MRLYTQEELDRCIQKAIQVGEDMAGQAYRNVRAITRISCFRWFASGFLSGAAGVLLYQVIA